ncbi:MAG: hypothetical protein KDC92_01555 [Bacteroidetes bacterium]|nr:hypothetical protein [Bacteroidota bacterium]
MNKITLLTFLVFSAQLLSAQITSKQIGGSFVKDTKNYGFANNGKLMALGSSGTGAYNGTSFLQRAGMVKLYLKSANGWENVKDIKSEKPGYEFGFGSAIAMNDKQLFITQSRSLFVYDIGDNDTNLTLTQTIDIGKSESLALYENTLVYRKSNGKYAISKLENNVWTETQEMQVGNNLYFDASYNIKIKDEWIFFGMPEYQLDKNGENMISESGMVVAYRLNSNKQYEFHSYIEPKVRKENSTWGYGEYFGWSVAYEAGWLAVSAHQAGGNAGRKQGGVYIFKLENNKWVEIQKLGSTSDYFLEQFGCGVTLVDGNLLVGNKNENPVEGGLTMYHFYRVGDNFQYKAKASAGAQKIIVLNDTFYSTYSNDEDVYLYEGTFSKEAVSITKEATHDNLLVSYHHESNSILIQHDLSISFDVEVYDLTGKVLFQQHNSSPTVNTLQVKLPHLNGQTLVVRCGNEVRKIMVMGN